MTKKPLLEKLNDSVEYLYFWRHWWPKGSDVVMVWRDASGTCRRYCEATGGESLLGDTLATTFPAQVIHDDVINSSTFEGLMRFALEHGILEAQTGPARTTAHLVDFYLVRTADGRTNAFSVGGGRTMNEQHNQLIEIFLGNGLSTFYEERNRRREEIAERELAQEELLGSGDN
ncbi:MAG TPA: hypothetical protein VIM11_16290 [Tepidisphaeraceae bacterium]|jgi:hypothetical protein